MPELAEVEYFRRRWQPGVGRKVAKVFLNPKARVGRGVGRAGRARFRDHGGQGAPAGEERAPGDDGEDAGDDELPPSPLGPAGAGGARE